MHTRQIDNATFIFNPDLSGDVRIIANGSEVLVPGAALKEFVSEPCGESDYARDRRIRKAAKEYLESCGPQRGPASVAQITAQVKQAQREVG